MRPGFDRRTGIAVAVLVFAHSAVSPSLADQVTADDLIVDGSLCAGLACANGEDFGTGILRLKNGNVRVDFLDTSGAGVPDRDWRIEVNALTGVGEHFAIRDMGDSSTGAEGGTAILQLTAGAPANSIFVSAGGNVGFGTATPTPGDELHILNGNTPTIKFEQDGSNGNDPAFWRVGGNHAQFFIQGDAASNIPFKILADAPSNTLQLRSDGRVNVGPGTADAPLTVRNTPTNIGAGNAVLKLVNPAGPTAMQMQPFGTGFFWNFAASDNNTFNINRSGNSSVEMSLNGAGNLTISGTLTTGGPTCSTGCDAVFDAEYALPSIEDHAAEMWAKKHLPNVGPTLPHRPVNLSEQYGRVLNELETAHIYIDQLHRRLEGQDAGIAQLRAEIDLLKRTTGDLATN
jgi:hypothetical protein